MNRNIGLFFPLIRHSCTYFAQEPVLEFLGGFKSAAADDQSVRVERIDHLIEEDSQRPRLYTEDFRAERVATLSHTANELGPAIRLDAGEFVTRILRQEERENRPLDRGQRAERFEIAGSAAIAERLHVLNAGDRLKWNHD